VQCDGRPERAEDAQAIGEAFHAREAKERALLCTFCPFDITGLPVAYSFCSPGIAPKARSAVLHKYFLYTFQCLNSHDSR
jgi:hypothetical protein